MSPEGGYRRPVDNASTHAILVPGFWLGGWAWEDVEPPLRMAGHVTHPVTLPGMDGSGTEGVTLETQIEAVSSLVDALGGETVLVGHSGGGAVVQGVVDRRPGRVRRAVYVDSGPLREGAALMPTVDDDVVLPSWESLSAQGSSLEGVDGAALARFRERAVPVPMEVARARVRLLDERRLDVPTSVVCTSVDSARLRRMIASGDVPSELESVRDVRFVDLPTGHWPMFSRAADLATVLREEIARR